MEEGGEGLSCDWGAGAEGAVLVALEGDHVRPLAFLQIALPVGLVELFELPLPVAPDAAGAKENGTAEQKRLYLPKLISGEWTGTMNLTEPQAGSDVGALRSRAERAPERHSVTSGWSRRSSSRHDASVASGSSQAPGKAVCT